MKYTEFERVTLERMDFAVANAISLEALDFIDPPTFKVWVDGMTRKMMVQMYQSVLGRELEGVTYSWPANWWQHFKHHWFPKWAKWCYPVIYEVHSHTTSELYPKISMPERGPVLHIEKAPPMIGPWPTQEDE